MTFHQSVLTADEKLRCEVLWRTYFRDLIHVHPTNEHKIKISDHDYFHIGRLHKFGVALLTNALNYYNSDNTNSKNTQNSPHVKLPGDSSLREFLALVLVPNVSSPTDNKQLQQRFLSTRPLERVAIPVHLTAFVSELREFELEGQQQQEDPNYRQSSYPIWLYHYSQKALPALGCSLALAMTTVKLQILDSSQQQQQMGDSHVLTAAQQQQLQTEFAQFCNGTQIVVRFLNVEPLIPMMEIKTGLVGKFIAIKGHIVKARPKKLRLATADFSCSKCGALITHAFTEGRYSAPTSCPGDKCSSRTFTMSRSTARYINIQELRLQESQDESMVHSGRAPRQIQVEIAHDLVESCCPGDMVQVSATVEAVNTALAAGKRGKKVTETSTYQLFLVGHSISTMSDNSNDGAMGKERKGKGSRPKFSDEQLRDITKLCHADHFHFGLMERRAFPFDLLVRSICPAIIGHNEVKAGLLLCLLGGTPQSSDNQSHVIRSNSHMLIVGDPGMGKSQMLLAASQLASRAVYVGGNTSSTTGLTVTLAKEDKGGQSTIEAGALVLADQGICCIDEFDKMAKNNQDGLLEAMEQQQVSIAKAGVVASLPARSSIIAAANPKQGTYNMNKTVSENLNMARPILSRFDLVFILRDRADSNLDQLVSSNIMDLYRKGQPKGSVTAAPNPYPNPAAGQDTCEEENRIPLSERLAWVTETQKKPLEACLIRDYIAYARAYCRPKLSPEAAAILKNYFMSLRYPEDGRKRADTVPITTRQLEALIRLCQARAKACLRELCLEEDALDVIDLMKQSVEQVHKDEFGTVDPIRGGAGGSSVRKLKKAFMKEMRIVLGSGGGKLSMDDLRRIAERAQCGLSSFHELIEDLRSDGVLLKISDGNGVRYEVLPC